MRGSASRPTFLRAPWLRLARATNSSLRKCVEAGFVPFSDLASQVGRGLFLRCQKFGIAIESKTYFHFRFCSSQILYVPIDIDLATVGFQPAGPYLTATQIPDIHFMFASLTALRPIYSGGSNV